MRPRRARMIGSIMCRTVPLASMTLSPGIGPGDTAARETIRLLLSEFKKTNL